MAYVSLITTKALRLFIFVIISLLFYPQIGQSAVFEVTNESELREALSIAESNGEDDVINIAAGVYHTFGEPFTFESDEDFSLTLEGEGAGLTILDGGETTRVLETNTVSDAAIMITIKGLTIQNGFHEGIPGDTQSNGAGISAVSQNVTIVDCEFINNRLSRAGSGGGLYANAQTKLDLSGNLFSGNSAAFDGGGAKLRAFELKIFGNQFIDNSAELGAGGGVHISSDEVFLSKNQFVENWSGENGGGVSVQEYFGGLCDSAITNNIFISNESTTNGGGLEISIYCVDIDYKIINNTFTLNSVDIEGGGIYFFGLQDDISFIPPRVQISILDIYNNIIFGNSAGNDGGDIYVRGKPDLAFSLFNNDYSDLCNFHSVLSCTEDANQANNIDEDPLFVDAEAGDVSLQPDSPCIDAGDPNAPDVPDTDIFGNLRVPPPDMGAVEYFELVVDGEAGGGCSIAHAPVSSLLAVFLAIPVLIIIRRFVKRYRD